VMRMRRQNTVIIIGLRFLLLACVYTADSFLHHNFNNAGWKNHPHRRICSSVLNKSASDVQDNAERDRTKYGMGGVDLYSRWITLVDQGHVTATTTLSNEEIFTGNNSDDDDDDDSMNLNVRYGVKLFKGEGEMHLVEFVELLNENNVRNSKMKDRILSINETLTEMQSTLWTVDRSDIAASSGGGISNNNTGLAIKCIYDGLYVAQLQLVRTLRPPRSKEMSGTAVAKTASNTATTVSCQPPPYNPSNSFLVGPLRLFGQGGFHGEGEPRVRMARLSATPNEEDQRMWDVYHNISPVDPRGHFLLVPDLEQSTKNWRDQSLIATDCHDITNLASTIQPPGSLMITFNSVGAGASQNHVHCHAWVCPPAPLVQEGRRKGYAVENAAVTSSLKLQHGTTVSLLDYPCTCIKLSVTIDGLEGGGGGGGGVGKRRRPSAALDEIGRAIATIVQIAQEMEAPHNVAWTNNNNNNNNNNEATEGSVVLTSYIFFRSKAETTIPNTNDVFRLGASEAMGVFHCSSNDQMESLSGEGFMESILRAVSTLPRDIIWNRVENECS
jgi:hypothetical protein